ncbi:MAG: guanylate kinase [Bacteroidetes bacterium]|nr:guanylate kinase [Bacteroidota bacterium]
MEGKLIIFSAPSGAGKTTIVHQLLASRDDLEFSISACSRPKRTNEIDGVDYYFISVEEFKSKIKNDEFLEWEEVYENSFYGTLKSEVERIWAKGKHVIFDVDVVGGLNIKKYGQQRALAIFVMPPSIEILEERLNNRSSETSETLKKRLEKANYELTFANKFDRIIINDNLESAIKESKATVEEFISNSV